MSTIKTEFSRNAPRRLSTIKRRWEPEPEPEPQTVAVATPGSLEPDFARFVVLGDGRSINAPSSAAEPTAELEYHSAAIEARTETPPTIWGITLVNGITAAELLDKAAEMVREVGGDAQIKAWSTDSGTPTRIAAVPAP